MAVKSEVQNEVLSEAEQAAHYRFLKAADPVVICQIAWRWEAACRFGDLDQAIAAAKAAHLKGELPSR